MPPEVISDIEKVFSSFHSEITLLADENNIDGKRRILAWSSHVIFIQNVGDVWYFLSRVPVYERDNNCRLVILVNKANADKIYEKARYFEYDGYSFEFLPIDLSWFQSISGYLISIHSRDHFFSKLESDKFRTGFSGRDDTGVFFSFAPYKDKEVRKPRFPHFNRQYYIDTYGINPGKTFWIITDSNYVKPLPISYWNAVAAILRNIGFTVLFNSKDSECDGTLTFIPLDDVIGFAELCGHVIGMRTGFFDFAIIAKAKFYIFTPPYFLYNNVADAFHVDNSDGHIRSIPILSKDDFTNLPEISCFGQVRKNFVEYIFELSLDMDRYTIFIASKYSHCPLPPEENKKLGILKSLGLAFDFFASYGWSYISVIHEGDVIVEKSSPDQSVSFTYLLANGESKVEIVSEGIGCGNECRASVIIDGLQTCMNKRGINFVVCDKNTGLPIESVVFDTFENSSLFDTNDIGRLSHWGVPLRLRNNRISC